MSGDDSGPTGPDLAAGVPGSDLADGVPLLGHVGDEAVALVRRGDEVFAISATCTHYGGPLAEGLVVGDTVRCPWHHACFSLRTGEALAAPALNPVACWSVETANGTVSVSGRKEELGPLAALGRRADGPGSVVIVGGGAAGSAGAEMLRRQGYEGKIALIDPERAAPYDRPNLSKDYLAGTAPAEWIPLRPEGFYEEHRIDRIVAEASAIDLRQRSVTLSDDRTLSYDALLLATGSEPVRLPIPGADLPHVHLLRSLTDCQAIIGAAEEAGSTVIVGASFIGMEVAASLRTRELSVTVVAPEKVPFERTLGADLGRLLQSVHEEHGVEFRLGHTVAAIELGLVRLDDGAELEADIVVVGVGVRPRTGLAEAAGLDVENGVLVDERLQTSVPGIYAAGDIARFPDPRTGDRVRIEHWVVAQRQGQAAAKAILGQRDPYGDVPFFWTQHYDLPVNYVGHAAAWDEAKVDGDLGARDATVRFLRGARALAVATVYRDSESLEAEARMQGEAAER